MANALSQMEKKGQPIPGTCILCNKEPSGLAMFVPQDPKPWGGKTGKCRVFVYAICQDCLDLDNSAILVENKITSESRVN